MGLANHSYLLIDIGLQHIHLAPFLSLLEFFRIHWLGELGNLSKCIWMKQIQLDYAPYMQGTSSHTTRYLCMIYIGRWVEGLGTTFWWEESWVMLHSLLGWGPYSWVEWKKSITTSTSECIVAYYSMGSIEVGSLEPWLEAIFSPSHMLSDLFQ